MNDITKKSIGMLIDELISSNIKCYMSQEIVMAEKDDKEKIAKAAKSAQELNKRRNLLIAAIDRELNNDELLTPSEKTY